MSQVMSILTNFLEKMIITLKVKNIQLARFLESANLE